MTGELFDYREAMAPTAGADAAADAAYSVGRALVESGRGLVDLVEFHHALLAEVAPAVPAEVLDRAAELLSSALSPAEMALSGYRESADRLRQLNAELEDRVAQRTTELARAEARYRRLVERIPAVTYVTEGSRLGRCLFASGRLRDVLGFEPADWRADPFLWERQILEEDRQELLERVRAWHPSEEPLRANYRMRHRDGSTVWIQEEAALDDEGDGGPVVRGLLLDVTEQRRLEELVRHAQRLDSVGQLAGGISHDFNNLLAVIKGHLELVLLDLPEREQRIQADLEEALNATRSASQLTRQLLAFSSHRIQPPRVVDVPALMRGLVRMVRRVLGTAIRVDLDLEEGLRVRIDPGQLDQVLVNLCVNARDAMPEGGRLVLRCRGVDEGARVRIEVEDEGTGIPDEVVGRIFEPFFTTKVAGRGTGLGLATCLDIVAKAGGQLRVETEVGVGSTFLIDLPRVDDRASPAGLAAVAPGPEGSERLLLVDDEQTVRELARRMLSRRGYEVEAFADAESALRSLAQGPPPALLVTDTEMPGMSGVELARRAREIVPGLPVLRISGSGRLRGGPAEVVEPPSAFLQKPFSIGRLAKAVRDLLDSA